MSRQSLDATCAALLTLAAWTAAGTTLAQDQLAIRGGRIIPIVGELQKYLGAQSVLTGFSLPGDNLHSPNEKLHLPTWKKGIEALIHFFNTLAG